MLFLYYLLLLFIHQFTLPQTTFFLRNCLLCLFIMSGYLSKLFFITTLHFILISSEKTALYVTSFIVPSPEFQLKKKNISLYNKMMSCWCCRLSYGVVEKLSARRKFFFSVVFLVYL